MATPPMFSAVTDDGSQVTGENATAIVPWWSVTKTVLAATALRLVDEGGLTLDEPIADKPYSLRHLLSHRAGLRCYSALPAYHDAVASGDTPWPVEKMLAQVDADNLAFEPGTSWAYSNVGYMLISRLIEDATGDPIEEAVYRLVLAPLDMRLVEFAVEPTDLEQTAWGNPKEYHPGWVYHGLLIGEVGEAALFVHRLLTGELLPPHLRYALVDAHPVGGPLEDRPWRQTGYGLGLMIGDMTVAGLAMGHSAGGPGSVGAVYHFPDLPTPRTVAVFAQAGDEGLCEWEAARLSQAG